jgi:penicillin-binding protein 1A
MSRRERQRRRKRHRGHPIRKVVGMAILITICGMVLGGLAIAGWVVAVADSAPNLDELTPRIPGTLSQVFAADGTSLGYIYSPSIRVPVQGSQIPLALKQATVAIEDRRFYQHGALDYQGILRAAMKDVFSGGGLQGASTLTMQLIDNTYMPRNISAHHNLKYKIVQAKLAEQLEGKHSKNWILDNYLNDVPYGTVNGQTAYGVGAAAEVFFNKPVWNLTLAQAALLAGLPQAPSEYNPFLDKGLARHRRQEVLQAMVNSHYITQAQADAADRERLGVQHNGTFSGRVQPYVFDYAVQQLHAKFCPNQPVTYTCPKIDQAGLKIYTTIDLQKEQEAEQAILAHEGGPGQPAAALASIDPTDGHILAIANSSSYSQSSFDYATQGHRQPGSSFKVFVLMTLIHDFDGDPNQTYYSSHFLAPGWLPSNPTYSVHTAEETYQGNIDVTKATIVSDNTVFAQLDVDVGPDKVRDTAYAMGITTHLDAYPAEAIGGLRIGVSPLEMADAYSTLANGGSHVPATIIDHIVFPNGSVMNLGTPPQTRVFTDGETAAATNVLKGVIQSGTGTAANYGCPAAGKTGTAENLENAWFVGYTPKLATAVWVGYPNANIPMANGFGGTLAAPIWHDYMLRASNGFCGDFPTPTTPWHGTAFVGNHSTTGNANVGLNNNPNSNQTYNPQLQQQPVQVPGGTAQTTPSGGGTLPPPGFGTGQGQGQGHGHGHGHGNGATGTGAGNSG